MVRKLILKLKALFGIEYNYKDRNFLALADISRSDLFSSATNSSKYIDTVYLNQFNLRIRKLPSSDYPVLQQILLLNEYSSVVNSLYSNFNLGNVVNIIDAGANVGFTSISLLSKIKNAKIACIEPDSENLAQLNYNLSEYIKKEVVTVFPNGLMNESDLFIETSRSFRDGNDWSVSVNLADKQTDLKSISIGKIMSILKWEILDIVKIDIEGGERFLFNDDSGLSWLSKTKIIAIEIHDEFDIREKIINKLISHSFLIFNSGEITIGVNAKLSKVN